MSIRARTMLLKMVRNWPSSGQKGKMNPPKLALRFTISTLVMKQPRPSLLCKDAALATLDMAAFFGRHGLPEPAVLFHLVGCQDSLAQPHGKVPVSCMGQLAPQLGRHNTWSDLQSGTVPLPGDPPPVQHHWGAGHHSWEVMDYPGEGVSKFSRPT